MTLKIELNGPSWSMKLMWILKRHMSETSALHSSRSQHVHVRPTRELVANPMAIGPLRDLLEA